MKNASSFATNELKKWLGLQWSNNQWMWHEWKILHTPIEWLLINLLIYNLKTIRECMCASQFSAHENPPGLIFYIPPSSSSSASCRALYIIFVHIISIETRTRYLRFIFRSLIDFLFFVHSCFQPTEWTMCSFWHNRLTQHKISKVDCN